jgi:hypothetical protein
MWRPKVPDFGPWLPDLPGYGHAGLALARNVYPSTIGYKPIKDFSAVTTALPSTWRGGGSFINTDGTTVTLAGTDGGLYAYISSAWVNKVSGTYSAQWRFAQYGAFVIGVNGSAPVKYTIGTATGAALGGTPPSATMIGIVRDFVFLAGNSSANSTVYWSSINNAEGWTIGTNQCDIQQLPDGGAITGIAGGEYGLVFQESAIHRFSYVGSPLIFQRDKISDGIGSVTPGSVATFGRMTFFLSGRGFYAVMDGDLTNIGDQKINDTFWSTYSRPDVENYMRCVIDPKRTLAIWSMPDRLWIYNWTLDRWTDVYSAGITGLSTGVNASVSLESIDTLYPSGLDSVPLSLDDPIFKGGDPLLTIVKSDNIVYSLGSSSNMQATLRYAITEPFRGRKTRVRRARLTGDATTGVTLGISSAGRLGDAQTTEQAAEITPAGYITIRVTGQFLQPQIDIAAGATWSFATGVDFYQSPGGSF